MLTEVVDSGGPSSTSATYSNGAVSIGLPGSSASSAAYNSQAGYVPQSIANSPPVASPATYTRAAGVSLKINIANLLSTSTSDPEGDVRTLQSVGPSVQGASISISGAWILYNPANGNNDSFSYTISDGQGNTATGTISVMRVNPVGASVNFALNGLGQPTMQFAGIPGYPYTIQRSPDLDVWTGIHTLNAPANGVFTFTDLDPLPGNAFYRMSYTPAP
jgi:hypothetical protein